MGLLSKINENRKAEKKVDDKVVTEISYPTGFLPLDYANGVRVTSYDKHDRPISHTDLIGVVGGTMVTVIGISGTGKSALAIELSSCGIHKFGTNSAVQHADLELASTMQRPMKVLRLPPSLLKDTYEIYRDKDAEHIIDQFKTHCLTKINNRKEFTYDTGVRDLYGDTIKELYPSSSLIDSFAMFKSKDVDLGTAKNIEDITHNMMGAQAAKFNRGVLTQMLSYGKKANVSIVCVNHLNQNVNTGFMPKPSQHMYFSQDETMPGGTACLFLANNIIKLKTVTKWNPGKEKDWDYGIPGFLVDARYIKSRTNSSNIPIELVFDQRRGAFSKTLTLLHYAFKNNILLGGANSLYVPGCQTKFTRKTFEDKLNSDHDLLQALYEACLPSLESMLSTDFGRNTDNETANQKLDTMYMALEEHEKDVQTYKKQGWIDFD